MTLLGLKAERGDRARIQTRQRNRLARLFAIAVLVFLDPAYRRFYLGDELALAISRPQLERTIGFCGRPVRKVGQGANIFLKV